MKDADQRRLILLEEGHCLREQAAFEVNNLVPGIGPSPDKKPQVEVWAASGAFVHAAYTKRKDDDDFGQAGTLVRKVMDNAQRYRLVSNVVGHLKDGVTEPVLARAFEYWRNIGPGRFDLAPLHA